MNFTPTQVRFLEKLRQPRIVPGSELFELISGSNISTVTRHIDFIKDKGVDVQGSYGKGFWMPQHYTPEPWETLHSKRYRKAIKLMLEQPYSLVGLADAIYEEDSEFYALPRREKAERVSTLICELRPVVEQDLKIGFIQRRRLAGYLHYWIATDENQAINSTFVDMGPIETKVYNVLLSHKGSFVSHLEIIREVWGIGEVYGSGEERLWTHVTKLRGRGCTIENQIGIGYRLVKERGDVAARTITGYKSTVPRASQTYLKIAHCREQYSKDRG